MFLVELPDTVVHPGTWRRVEGQFFLCTRSSQVVCRGIFYIVESSLCVEVVHHDTVDLPQWEVDHDTMDLLQWEVDLLQ